MNNRLPAWALLLVACFFSCKAPQQIVKGKDDNQLDLTLLQINDVYEIAPLEGGKTGGMARVATLKQEALKANPNTLLIMAGDFLSPSVYNSLKYKGTRIRGQQMVDAMNAAGVDLAVFGNHEFDITETELQARLNESRFAWVATNTFHKKGDSVFSFAKQTSTGMQPFPQTQIKTFTDADGTSIRVGFLGLTLPFNKASYVQYTNPLLAAEEAYTRIKDSCDAVVALTHQLISDDSILAQRLPNLALIIGGHEHDMRFKKVGNVLITKAHANARTVYQLTMHFTKSLNKVTVVPLLLPVDTSVLANPATDLVVQKWTEIAAESYASSGFDAQAIIRTGGDSLEAREEKIRKAPTNFSKVIVAAMHQAVPQATIALFNAGSIRVDDVLYPPVSQYDILRSLPFGGGIATAVMKGNLLTQVLDSGRANKGIGGFLHFSEALTYNEAASMWMLNNKALDTAQQFTVALPEFLLTGGEARMNFLTPANTGIVSVSPPPANVADIRADIRMAIIRYLQNQKP